MTKALIAVAIVAVLAVGGFLLVGDGAPAPEGTAALVPDDPLAGPTETSAEPFAESPAIAATDTLEATVSTAVEDLRTALTVENFDRDAIIDALQSADIDPARRDALVGLIEITGDDPESLAPVLEQVRTALNM